MEYLSKQLVLYIRSNWYRLSGLIAVLGLYSILFLPFLWKNFGEGFQIWELVIFILCAITIAIVLFIIARGYPKNNTNNSIGIIIAITTDNNNDYLKLKSDFIDGIRTIVSNTSKVAKFTILALPEHLASKVIDHNSAKSALAKTNGHFIIYGTCKKRLHGTATYFLQLNAVVVHSTITPDTSNAFSNEFTQVFPASIFFPETREFVGFEITNNLINIATKYIVGIAAALSRDYYLAYGLFTEVKTILTVSTISVDQIQKIRNRIDARLLNSVEALANYEYLLYKKSKDPIHLNNTKNYLDSIESLGNRSYSGHLLRAIYYFKTEHSVSKAMAEIKKCKNNKDSSWLYSEGFLWAYSGNMAKAEKSYKKAFRSAVPLFVILNVEEFIYEVLDNESNKIQLWYVLGLINYKVKHDNILARDYFQRFLNSASTYTPQIGKAQEYINCLK